MQYRFVIGIFAESDYERIIESFLHVANFPEFATKKARAMREKMRTIAQFPYRFPQARGDHWNGRTIHYQVIDTFVVFFEINDEAQTVTVLRVLDYRTDLADFLGEGICEQD